MDPATIALLIIQAGVSIFNQYKNRKLTEQLKKEQREAKIEDLRGGQQHDMEKFMRSCELQRRLELELHQEKIESLKYNFLDSLKKMFANDSLNNAYKLSVSPYVLQQSIIPLGFEDINNVREELFCILTGSNDDNFNKYVLPYLDDAICDLISIYWNNSDHTIVYYENLWNCEKGPFSHEDLENIRPLIPNATLAITPLFKQTKDGYSLVFSITMWGIDTDGKMFNAEISTKQQFSTLPLKYELTDINSIVSSIAIDAICAIAQMADFFYWMTELKPPMFPGLVASKTISLSDELLEQLIHSYTSFYKNMVIGVKAELSQNVENIDVAQDIIAINQYNFPERGLPYLDNLLLLTKASKVSEELIQESLYSFYKTRTDKEINSLKSVETSSLKIQDFDYILELITNATNSNLDKVADACKAIVLNKICEWNTK